MVTSQYSFISFHLTLFLWMNERKEPYFPMMLSSKQLCSWKQHCTAHTETQSPRLISSCSYTSLLLNWVWTESASVAIWLQLIAQGNSNTLSACSLMIHERTMCCGLISAELPALFMDILILCYRSPPAEHNNNQTNITLGSLRSLAARAVCPHAIGPYWLPVRHSALNTLHFQAWSRRYSIILSPLNCHCEEI